MENTEQNKSTRDGVAGPTGFEPATSRLTIWRPNLAERRPRNNLVLGKQPTAFFRMGSEFWCGLVNISD